MKTNTKAPNSAPGRSGQSQPLYFTWRSFFLTLFAGFYVIPALIYRLLVVLAARLCRPDLSHLLQSHGPLILQSGVHVEPAHNQVVELRLRGAFNLETLRSIALTKAVHAKGKDGGGGGRLICPEFQQYCVRFGGYFFWKNETCFRIEEHVLHRRIDIDASVTTTNFDVVRTEYVREPLPKGKSPWQLLAVDSNSTDEFIILLKWHHSLGDGFSILHNTLLRCVDSPPLLLDYGPSSKSRTGTSTSTRRFDIDTILAPFRFVCTLIRMLTLRSPLLPWPSLKPEPYAGCGPEARERSHWTPVEAECVSMQLVKQIARGKSVSVSGVIYAALAGGLRTLLVEEYGADSIPTHIAFPQIVPAPRRRPDCLVNKIAWVTFRLPVGEPDASRRLQECDRMLRDCKGNGNGSMELVVSLLLNGALSALPTLFRHRLSGGAYCMSTSNMPLPLSPVSIGGQPVLSITLQLGAVLVPFYVSFVSYNGELRWTCNGDKRVFKSEAHVARIGQLIRQEFNALATR